MQNIIINQISHCKNKGNQAIFSKKIIIFFLLNSASNEYRNMSAMTGAQLVPIGMPIICWKHHKNVVN